MTVATASVRVLFRVAAGPRVGFGHLVRCGVLADALGAPRDLSLRGSAAATRAARHLGWRVHPNITRAFSRVRPDLVVIDDPTSKFGLAWLAAARRRGVPVASLQDRGHGWVPADLTIDGALDARRMSRADLRGPAYAVLSPAVSAARAEAPVRDRRRVLIALGGGAHALNAGPQLARAILERVPDALVQIAIGFAARRRLPLPAGAEWITRPAGLAHDLAVAGVAVAAGGVTLSEAAALGTPTVAVAVVPAQRAIVAAFRRRGAVIDGGALFGRRPAIERVADHVARLIAGPRSARAMGGRARTLVDGRGTDRVVVALRALAARRREGAHAA